MKLLIRNNLLPANQRGFIILAMLLILVIGGSTLALGGLSNRQSAYLKNQLDVQNQLALAKANLLAYIANSNTFYANAVGPGFFPCPDTDNDGYAETTCDPTNTTLPSCNSNTSRPAPRTGWLPEYVDVYGNRLELSNYYPDDTDNDATDENAMQFWYIVAPRYVYHSSSTTPRRSRDRTSTSFTVTSPGPACMRMYLDNASEYVALLIAPGEALGDQQRSISDTNTAYANYLDGENGSSNYYYYTSNTEADEAVGTETFNDLMIGITLDEYVKAVGMRVAMEMKEQLDTYHTANAQYPSTTTLFRQQLDDTTSPTDHAWLRPNGISGSNGEIWPNYTTYVRNSVSKVTINFSGCTGIKFIITPSSLSFDPANKDSC